MRATIATLCLCLLCLEVGFGEDLLSHVQSVDGLGELRGLKVDFIGPSNDRRLELSGTPLGRYAWVVIAKPGAGWNLSRSQAIEVDIENNGSHPVKLLFWIVGERGWDAVADTFELGPGLRHAFRCDLRSVFPDGTPKLDPNRIKQIQIMVVGAKQPIDLSVLNLRSVGDIEPFQKPLDRLNVPEVSEGMPEPGQPVRYRLEGEESSRIYSILHLPTDWKIGKRFPLVVEYPGNIYFTPDSYSTGRPDQCIIGYGMTRGAGAICLSLPFIDSATESIAEHGWGDPDATADYCLRAVEEVVRKFGADRNNIVLTGFSRGGLACGFIGLRNDRIAGLWKGFHACQHYDGDGWQGATMESALIRAERFRGRSLFMTDNSEQAFRPVVEKMNTEAVFVRSGLGAHACAMFLDDRPSTQQLRNWFADLVAKPARE